MTDIEIVVFNDKSWIRFAEYQKLQKENEQLIIENEEMKKGLGCETCQIHMEFASQNNEIRKLSKDIDVLTKEKCELLGIIQKKDELINKLICCDNCKHFNKVRCCRNDDKCIWELAE